MGPIRWCAIPRKRSSLSWTIWWRCFGKKEGRSRNRNADLFAHYGIAFVGCFDTAFLQLRRRLLHLRKQVRKVLMLIISCNFRHMVHLYGYCIRQDGSCKVTSILEYPCKLQRKISMSFSTDYKRKQRLLADDGEAAGLCVFLRTDKTIDREFHKITSMHSLWISALYGCIL